MVARTHAWVHIHTPGDDQISDCKDLWWTRYESAKINCLKKLDLKSNCEHYPYRCQIGTGCNSRGVSVYGGGPGSSGQHTVKAKGIISHVCIHNGIVQITHFSRTPFDILQAHLYSIQSVHKHQSPWIGIGPTCTQFPTLFTVRFYHNKFARFPSSTSKPFHCCTSLECHASRWAPLRGILQKKKKSPNNILV